MRNQHLETEIETTEDPPDDLESSGAYVASGEVLTSTLDEGAIYVARTDGTFERWLLEETEVGCA